MLQLCAAAQWCCQGGDTALLVFRTLCEPAPPCSWPPNYLLRLMTALLQASTPASGCGSGLPPLPPRPSILPKHLPQYLLLFVLSSNYAVKRLLQEKHFKNIILWKFSLWFLWASIVWGKQVAWRSEEVKMLWKAKYLTGGANIPKDITSWRNERTAFRFKHIPRLPNVLQNKSICWQTVRHTAHSV